MLKSTGAKWSDHNAPRLGASLAYYTLLSMAPLLVLVIYICGRVLSQTTAEQDLLDQVRALAGYSSAKTVQTLIENTHHASGSLATSIAVITSLFGASGVFVELRDSLNTIWDAPPRPSSTWRDLIWQRVFSFGMVIALGLLLLISLLISAAVTLIEKFFGGFVPFHFAVFSEIANFLISLVAISTLFALIFKFVPDVPIRWHEVTIGAAFTAVLFIMGKALLALYIGTAGVGSTYGAAGSLVALVAWVYYSAQIFFFGAIFTRLYADHFATTTAKKERAAVRSSAELVEGHHA